MSKKDNSRALIRYGEVEEYASMGCSPKTIARLTGLTVPKVKGILKIIDEKKKIIRGEE